MAVNQDGEELDTPDMHYWSHSCAFKDRSLLATFGRWFSCSSSTWLQRLVTSLKDFCGLSNCLGTGLWQSTCLKSHWFVSLPSLSPYGQGAMITTIIHYASLDLSIHLLKWSYHLSSLWHMYCHPVLFCFLVIFCCFFHREGLAQYSKTTANDILHVLQQHRGNRRCAKLVSVLFMPAIQRNLLSSPYDKQW